MPSDHLAGSLLRTLVASKPGGRFLELGTGIGLSLSWMVQGMDHEATLISIDNDPDLLQWVRPEFPEAPGLQIVCEDAARWIKNYQGPPFDLIFADAWPGKYSALPETLDLVKVGGFYVVDDMLEQANWPEGHAEKAATLSEWLMQLNNFEVTQLDWSTGIFVCTKTDIGS